MIFRFTGRMLAAAAFAAILTGTARAEPECRFCLFGLNGPRLEGASLSFEYGYVDMNRNWSGSRSAPAADNTDKRLRDETFLAGAGIPFGEDWSVQIELPYVDRLFVTDENGPVEPFRHSGFGDVLLTAAYSGLLPDDCLELVFGFKLPTGDTGYAGFPGDGQIGTGSTDLVLDLAYKNTLIGNWNWSGEILWSKPFAGSHRFKPGSSYEAALALSYEGLKIDAVHLTPSLQLVAETATKDAGIDADAPNSGGSSVALAPSLELSFQGWSLAGEVSFPVYQYVRGNQLVAHQQYKLILSYALGEDET